VETLPDTRQASPRRVLGAGPWHQYDRRESGHTPALTAVNGLCDTLSGADVLRWSWLPLYAEMSSVVESLEHLAIRGYPEILISERSIYMRELANRTSLEEHTLLKQEEQLRKSYLSDLTDEQWAMVAPLIPPAKQNPRRGRPRPVDRREALHTMFYQNRTGCQWDMLPHD
jgi:hypothetical protein